MRKVKTRGGGIMILLMMVIVATNVIASQPPKRRPTVTPHARANISESPQRYLSPYEKMTF